MVGINEGGSNSASEDLLTKICGILFQNSSRYLQIKQLFPKDFFENSSEPKRFKEPMGESDDAFKIENRCPKDLADYINGKGGWPLQESKRKVE